MSLALAQARDLGSAPQVVQARVRRQLAAVALVEQQAARSARVVTKQRDADPLATRREACQILLDLPVDPAAARHRDEIAAECAFDTKGRARANMLHAAIMGGAA